MYLWGMNQVLSSGEFKEKLQTLHEERGVTTRLRTHLRRLLLSELQSGPTARAAPPVTVRGRALGSMLVEWLRIHECHYTLSVLVSEVPSLADLPGLVGEGDRTSLKKEEAQEVLIALGLDSQEIMKEYQKSTDSLLSCAFKVASMWKERLKFKELSVSPIRHGEGVPGWGKRMQEIIASACVLPDQLNSVYSALYSLIQNELDTCLAEERRSLWDELVTREERIKEELHQQEQSLVTRLAEVEQGLSEDQQKAAEELDHTRQMLTQLMAEVQNQHQAVVDGLVALEEREKHFEAARKAWKNDITTEKRRQSAVAEELAQQQKEIDNAKELLNLKANELELKSEKITKSLMTQGTCTTPPQEQIQETPSSEERRHRRFNGENGQPGSAKLPDPVTPGYLSVPVRSRSPIDMPSTSHSSQPSSDQSDGATAPTWKRLKELRAETLHGRDEFEKYRKTLSDSNSSSSDGEENHVNNNTPSLLDVLHPRTRTSVPTLRSSQVTFPYLREGCHSEVNPLSFGGHRRRLPHRYGHLLSQGDQPIQRPPTTVFSRIPRRAGPPAPEAAPLSYAKREATRRMREESARLEILLRSTRDCSPTYQNEWEPITKYQDKRDSQKFDTLLTAVRTRSPTNVGSSREKGRDVSEEKETSSSKGSLVSINETSPRCYFINDRQFSGEREKDGQKTTSTPSEPQPAAENSPESVVKEQTNESNSSRLESRNLNKSGGKMNEANSSSSSHERTPLRESKLPSLTRKTPKQKRSSSPTTHRNQPGAGEYNIQLHRQREIDSLASLCQTGWLGAGETIPIPRRGRLNETNHLETRIMEEATPGSGGRRMRATLSPSTTPGAEEGSTGLKEPTGGSESGDVIAPIGEREPPGEAVVVGPSILMQAALEDVSDVSEGEVVSVGHPKSPDDFWS